MKNFECGHIHKSASSFVSGLLQVQGRIKGGATRALPRVLRSKGAPCDDIYLF